MHHLQNKNPKNYSEIYFSSLIDDLNNSPEMVSDTLKEYNIDENQVAKKGVELAGKLIVQMRIKEAKELKQTLFQKALSLLSNANISLANLNPKEKLYNLLSTGQNSVSFTFNNLQNVSNPDILEMLSEIQVIELIEELEKSKDQ